MLVRIDLNIVKSVIKATVSNDNAVKFSKGKFYH
ncbi:MAG: hypothetical protein ACI9LM_000912 [Alteromonadaceae bacterium]|jgi:hypothetical protein